MKIFGTFVGVNKHKSPDVNELTSAVRDAQALWALFSDTFPDLQADLLLDERASALAIRESVAKTLGDAGTDDVAIVSFSGHGTRSHRLVPHDADRTALDTTTIPMEFLADSFKRSKAKAIICILDCCFSGGAPAKVFADTPTPRDLHDPYEVLTGKGRILIAASNAAQPAWERPGIGHGLLTEAVIRILRTGEKYVDVTAAIFQIMEIVQAEATRIGVTQTPVVLSLVEGGLTFPSLIEGDNFKKAFPERFTKVVSKDIRDLEAFGLPQAVLEEWYTRFPDGLNSLQLKAVNEFKILNDQSLLVVAPTSSGKTFVGELAAARAVTAGRKAVFLLPYRALVNEKYDQFRSSYADKLGLRVIRCNGDYADQASTFVKGQFDLAVLTFEMFLNLVVANPGILNQLGLIVLDEAQFVTDPNRGINIELLLTSVLTARERGVQPQVVALSAVIGDVNKFDAWLGLQLLHTTERPVPLIEGVIDRSGTFQFRDVDGSVKQEQLVPARDIRVRKEKPSAQDVIVPLSASLVAKGEKLLIFRNMRGPAQGCANYLANDLGLPRAQKVLASLPELDQSASSQSLRRALEGGTAFHTSNLSREEREAIEKGFRDSGEIAVLAATTTVAAGINTPASTVIIAEQEFIGEDGREFTVAEYKNMAGRAGRLGYKEIGRSIIYAENSMQRAQLFQKYVLGWKIA